MPKTSCFSWPYGSFGSPWVHMIKCNATHGHPGPGLAPTGEGRLFIQSPFLQKLPGNQLPEDREDIMPHCASFLVDASWELRGISKSQTTGRCWMTKLLFGFKTLPILHTPSFVYFAPQKKGKLTTSLIFIFLPCRGAGGWSNPE